MGVASTLGQPVRRREDARLLAGQGVFLDDVPMPDALHMAFVRSPHAFARFELKGPGPLAFTAAGIAGRVWPVQIVPPPGLDVEPIPHPVLADGEVRYVGQPVAAVVAESRALAEDLAERVAVEYEPLAPVVDARAGDPLVRWEKREGDVAGAFSRAAHVIRTEREIPRLAAVPMEPRGALARLDDDGRLTVWTSSQSAHRPRVQLAQCLGRDEAWIRVIVPDVGGAFGSKGTLPVETPLVAFAAASLGRPVRWAEDRYENFLAAPQGRGIRGWVELALDEDGRILALRGRVLADLGAYLLPSTPMPPHTTAMLLAGAYDVPAVEVIVTGARTNKVPTAPYRGAGRPEASFLIETAIDEAARRLRMDPIELRRRNLVRSFPHTTALGWTYDSGDYEACLDRAIALVGDVAGPGRETEPAAADDAPRSPEDAQVAPAPGAGPSRARRFAPSDVLVGVGFALVVARSGGLHEHASVTREGDEIVVRAGSVPSGQGHETLFAAIAAERLGVDPATVRVITGDSDALADGVGSFASRTTAMGGSAVAAAADDLAAGGPGVARFASEQLFTSGAYAAVVEVVRATGEVRVRRLVCVDDAGRILNPLTAEGQVVGGAIQGVGAMLTEAVVHDAAGRPVSASLLDYSLLTAAEIPQLTTAFVESPTPLNPLGAKGIGESGIVGAPPAIANALADAIGRHLDPPYTAEKVWAALR